MIGSRWMHHKLFGLFVPKSDPQEPLSSFIWISFPTHLFQMIGSSASSEKPDSDPGITAQWYPYVTESLSRLICHVFVYHSCLVLQYECSVFDRRQIPCVV